MEIDFPLVDEHLMNELNFESQQVAQPENEESNEENYKVIPKLHHIQHYYEAIQFYGPLALYSTLKFERKHQVFKQHADILKNFKNPTKSFAIRNQLALSVKLNNMNFSEIDFFLRTKSTTESEESRIVDLIKSTLPNAIPLLSTEYPRPVNQSTAVKINHPRFKYWLRPQKYFKLKSDGSIFASGKVYELKKRFIINDLPDTLHNQFQFIKLKFPEPKYIKLDHLNYRLDYVYEHRHFGDYIALMKGLV